jgi:hypothetical protein
MVPVLVETMRGPAVAFEIDSKQSEQKRASGALSPPHRGQAKRVVVTKTRYRDRFGVSKVAGIRLAPYDRERCGPK